MTVQLATHMGSIEDYISRTLLYHTMDGGQLEKWVKSNIQELLDSGQITVDAVGSYEATPLSQATVGSCMTPEDGIFVYEELRRALRAFVMDGEMHIFYTFTPVNIWGLGEIDWPIFRREMDRLDESGLRVLEFVGINPGFVNKM